MGQTLAKHRACLATCLLGWLGTSTALAQTPPPAPASQGNVPDTLWQQNTLLGDMGGLRPALDQYGITFTMSETSEVLGNLTGGLKQGSTYDGLTQAALQLDTRKAFGWEGGTFNISALQIHGRNFSEYYLDNLQAASSLAADDSTRLWELWYQQSFLGGKFDIRIGQQSVDQEFIVSPYSSVFLNTALGWPAISDIDLPSGGPAYPLATPGIRLRAQPTDALSVLAGIFNGNPAGRNCVGDPQVCNASGTLFPLNAGVLAIAEIRYAVNPPPSNGSSANGAPDAPPPSGLPGTYKLGFWYDSNQFADQQFSNTGLSLANPANTGAPLGHHGNFSIFGMADQALWRPDPKGSGTLNAFARVQGAPDDRNQVSFAADAGLTLSAPFAGRDGDTAGIGVGYAKVSPRVAADDSSANAFGTPTMVQGSETFLELTYQCQITPWWQLQPDFQYVFDPRGGALNPDNPSKRIGNEAVIGLRTVITF